MFFVLAGNTTQDTAQRYQVVIIGSGVAGLTAATYAGRAKLKPLVIEGSPGGIFMSVEKIHNWPGEETIAGLELMQKMLKQAKNNGAVLTSDIVTSVDLRKRPFTLKTVRGKTILADSLIIATGMTPKKIGCSGESEYRQKGICNCALCDAPLFNKQKVVVVGGGHMALQNTRYLTKYAKQITIINDQNFLTGPETQIHEIENSPIITILNNHQVTSINGDGEQVTSVDIVDQNGNKKNITTDGVFVSLGYEPNTALFKDQLAINCDGRIETSPLGHTNIPGVFVAGSCGTMPAEQAIVCAAFGCITAIEAGNFIGKKAPASTIYRCQKERVGVS